MLDRSTLRLSFPSEAARDLLGLLRAMYLAEKRKDVPSKAKMKLLTELARELKAAEHEARQSAPQSFVYEESIQRADRVVARLADLVTCVDPALPILLAAGERVRRGRRS